jgi:hypothetical protein
MGGSFSKPLNNTKMLYDEIDYIAADYILTSDFKSLERLKEKEYCNKLVVLTSEILEKYLAPKDIVFLQQKMKKGFDQPINAMLKDRVAFLKEEEMGDLDVHNTVKKKRLCIGIAKQYVRVAHIFASIVTAINPVYKYTDKEGGIRRIPLYKKDEIPASARTTIERFNICENRIKALLGTGELGLEIDELRTDKLRTGTSEHIIISPSICQASLKPGGDVKSLTDEPGIPELMQLYYDKYDYSTGEFVGMTEKTKKVYKAHVDIFNAAFSGATESDPEIKEFADIKLRDYNKQAYCDGNAVTSQKKYSSEHATEEERILFTRYAEHVKEMVANANKNQNALLEIIHELFTQFPDPNKPNKTHYKVNSKLNDVALEKLVRKTRDLIVKLFSTCEKDYETGVKLYEAIVNTIVIKTTDAQIENMNEVKTGLLEPLEPVEPVLGLKPEDVTEEPVDQGIIGSTLSSFNPFSEKEEEPSAPIRDRSTSSLIEEENKLLTPESPDIVVNNEKRDEYGNATVESTEVQESTVVPTEVQEPVAVVEPVAFEPTEVQEPVAVEEPVSLEEPVSVVPTELQEPVAVVEPVAFEPTEVQEPVALEEPVAVVPTVEFTEAKDSTVEPVPFVEPDLTEKPVVLNKEEDASLLKKENPSGGRRKSKKRKQSKKKKQTKKRKGDKGRKTEGIGKTGKNRRVRKSKKGRRY